MVNLVVNGREHSIEADPDMPLLWVLRDMLGLTGTKFGCGIGACGACTVHSDGEPVRSCIMPLSAVEGAEIVTVEGLSTDNTHVVQAAWIESQVPQCGYCQSGMIMAVAGLLRSNPRPSDQDIDAAITNICRCGTHQRIRAAIRRAASKA